MVRYTSTNKTVLKGILIISALAAVTSMGLSFATISLTAQQNGISPSEADIHDPNKTLTNLANTMSLRTDKEVIDDLYNIGKIPDRLLQELVNITTGCENSNVAALQFWPLDGQLSSGFRSLIIGTAVGTLILACIQLIAAIVTLFSSSLNFVSRIITWRITLALCLPLTLIATLAPFTYEPMSNDKFSTTIKAIPKTFAGLVCLLEMNKDPEKLWQNGLSSLYMIFGNVSYAGFQLCLMIISILVGYCDGKNYSQV